MTRKSWTLTDVEQDTYVEDLTIEPSAVGGSATGYHIRKGTLRGGLCDGVDVVEVATGPSRVTIVPTRGMGIWKLWIGETAIGWQSPIRGPVHPQYVPLADPSGLGWLDGFDELVARCGLESNGAPDFDDSGRLRYALHGRIANRPAHKVDLTVDGETGAVAVTGVVDESRFHFQKLRLTSTVTIRPDTKGVAIHDRVTNLSGDPTTVQLLYHINLGPPVLEPGARLIVPVRTVAPRDAIAAQHMDAWDIYAPEQANFSEQVAFFELVADDQGATRALLRNAAGSLGVSLAFNTRELPCFTLWKNTPMAADGYVTGLEPGTNFPNPRTFETKQGRTVSLQAGQSVTFDVTLQVHTGETEVAAEEQAIARLQGETARTILKQPRPGWSPE